MQKRQRAEARRKTEKGNEVEGVLCVRKPWPSIARTVYGDHKRFLDTYMNEPGLVLVAPGKGLHAETSAGGSKAED
jgi:acyl-coenzyme A synthetase/AMP-(fatty) acid ligase